MFDSGINNSENDTHSNEIVMQIEASQLSLGV